MPVDLDVPPTSLGRVVNARILLAFALAGAIVGYGVAGRFGPEGAVPAGTESPAATRPAPDVAARPVSRRATIERPREGETIRGAVLELAGTVPPGVRRVAVSAHVAGLLAGSGRARVDGGSFELRLPVLAPVDGSIVVLNLTVRDDASGLVLARRPISVAGSPGISGRGSVAYLPSGHDHVDLAGNAALGDGPFAVTALRGTYRRSVTSVVRPVADPATARAAERLGLGRWTAALSVPATQEPITVEIRAAGAVDSEPLLVLQLTSAGQVAGRRGRP